jgi:predicted enzyme related to lactoylglutathione lyase
MSNPFVHLELSTSDVAAAKAFYSGLFGWAIQDMDMGGGMIYSTFKPASGPGGGMFSMPGMPTFWLAYVGVKDINESTEKAKSLGATIHRGPMEIPNIGWMTILVDPTGATIAMFQPKDGAQQPPPGNAGSSPFVHLELCSPDVAAAKAFYSGLFGWAFTDTDMGGGMIYSTFHPSSGPGGGLFTMPGVPNAWLAYVGVEDINASTDKAKSLGATVYRGPHEIPNIGWFTILGDPTGATIALFEAKTA